MGVSKGQKVVYEQSKVVNRDPCPLDMIVDVRDNDDSRMIGT